MTQPYTSAFFSGRSVIAAIRGTSPPHDHSSGSAKHRDRCWLWRRNWLAVLTESGVPDVWGIDGDYVDRSLLQIPRERFLPHDLTMPIHLERRFDLVLCLEVAEHLPADSAPTLVDSLVGLGP